MRCTSQAATNDRNRGIAHLLDGYDRMYCDPDLATDVYTRQCSVRVSARDLAVMGATLANGGVNPVTGEQAIDTRYCKRVLAVLATAGLYEQSGQWLYDVGLPGKSGVAGGIVTVSPGKGGLGTFSPPLDAAGNSVRGQLITRYLSEALGLNLFASAPRPDIASPRIGQVRACCWWGLGRGRRCPRYVRASAAGAPARKHSAPMKVPRLVRSALRSWPVTGLSRRPRRTRRRPPTQRG